MVVQDKWVHGQTPIMKDEIPLHEVTDLKVADLILPQDHGCNIRKIHRLFVQSSVGMITKIELPMSQDTGDAL